MPQETGTVARIFSTERNTARGVTTLYSFVLHEQEKVYYNCKFKKPNCSENDVVTFNWEEENYRGRVSKNVDVDSIVVSGTSAPEAPKSGTTTKSGGGKNWAAQDKYWQDKAVEDKKVQLSIQYQSAVSRAVELIKLSSDLNALPLTKSQIDNPKKRWECVEALVQQYAAMIFTATRVTMQDGVPPANWDSLNLEQQGAFEENTREGVSEEEADDGGWS